MREREGRRERERKKGGGGRGRVKKGEREREPYLVGVVLWVLERRRQDLGSEIAIRYNYNY